MNEEYWWNDTDRGKQKGALFRRKTCSSVTLVTQAPTWPGEEWNLVLRGDNPVTSHGAAIIVRVFTTIYLEQTTFLGCTVAAILCLQCMPRAVLLPV
jgi:hypothetical protein